ncbi:MAG: hypothetical protein SWO11_22960 [Thermodesulfobacteriota bacterium]|nr:hypothetical protein [Thermodesulfobacteriota bacterium]
MVILDFGGNYGWRLDDRYGSHFIVLDGFTIINTNWIYDLKVPAP